MGFMLFRQKFNEKIVNMENMSTSTLLVSHIFRSVGQVMFLDCPVAGAFICIGILTAQPQDLAFGLLATMTALFMTLKMLGPHVFQGLLRRNLGLFGFNAVLVGIGISVFLNWDKNSIGDWFLLLIPTIFFGVFSSFIKMMIESLTHTLPCLTFPFNLTMTVWLTFSYAVAWAPSAFVSSPATSRNVVDDFEEYLEEIDVQKVAQAIMKGFSQVYLVDSWECGVLILVGMLYHDVEVAILALSGSSIGTFGALLMGVNKIAIYKGLFGFNSCLVAIVCGKVLVNIRYLNVRHKRYLSALLFSNPFDDPLYSSEEYLRLIYSPDANMHQRYFCAYSHSVHDLPLLLHGDLISFDRTLGPRACEERADSQALFHY